MRTSRSVRRVSGAFLAAVLPLTALAACGSSDDQDAGLDQVTVSGELGLVPEVEIDGELSPEGFASETVIEGDGPTVEEGSNVVLQAWIGNGFSGQEAFSTWEYGDPGILPVSSEAPSTTVAAAVQQTAASLLLDPLTNAMPASIADSLEGVKAGSRVLVVSDYENAFGGDGQANIGIGNRDSVVYVIDVLAVALDGPEGTEVAAPEGLPTLVESGDEVTGFDFEGAAEPTDELQVATLVEGDGPVVEEGALLVANYLGQVYGGEAPFDESYSGGLPRTFVVGGPNAGVIEGWNEALVGLKAGTRVVLGIPPALGYGETGNEQAGIAPTDTLYFVVDVLGSVVLPEAPAETESPDAEATDPAATDPTDPAATDPAATESTEAPADPTAPATE
ncbi:FKBP-type peptidyl-prolyl cis-trans isomerase [Nocardioides zeae]|uniref:peptidylprolyl isomerase n=1 Tax=Nocardioides zeae TaxID=1457234 RepID=A0A6P0HI73_9ACTN|nr:FKBP-type peptidyl-prolyl cis-trans isomerase [Nocardioides zeae]